MKDANSKSINACNSVIIGEPGVELEIYLVHLNEKFRVDGAWNSIVPSACRNRQISSTKESMPGRNDRFAMRHSLVSQRHLVPSDSVNIVDEGRRLGLTFRKSRLQNLSQLISGRFTSTQE